MKNYETTLSSTIPNQKLYLLHSCSSREPSTLSGMDLLHPSGSLAHEGTFLFPSEGWN